MQGMADRELDSHWESILGSLADQHNIMDWIVDTSDAVPGA